MQFDEMMRQAQKLQQKMARMKEDMNERVVEGAGGGGAVRAFVNGRFELLRIKIDPAAVDPDDVEMLEDLVVAAVRDATAKVRRMVEEEMGKMTAGLPIPPGMLGF